MIKNSALKVLLVVALLSFSSIPAYADTVEPLGNPTDIRLYSGTAFSNQLFSTDVCNDGTDTVISLHFDYTISDFTVISEINSPRSYESNAPTDFGTLDSNGDWTGILEGGQCLTFAQTGNSTAAVGETMQYDTSVSNVILADDSVNVDPDESNNSDSIVSPPVTLPADIAIESRLLTSGTITSGSEVRYELTISNIGQGEYRFDEGFLPTGVYAILPTGATLIGAIDVDPSDGIELFDADPLDTPVGYDTDCDIVPIDVTTLPGDGNYEGSLYGCNFTSSSDPLASGESFKIIYAMTANGSFASGATSMVLALSGNDGESYLFQQFMLTGIDPFAESIERNMNNVTNLTYDATELTATVARCEGVGEVVTVDDACFTMTFNKPVYEGDFTIDDLIVENGSVYSFIQDSPTQWTIRINEMTPNATLTINLGLGSVVDLSAFTNTTYVLGINTIRYEVPVQQSAGSVSGDTTTGATTATGTLSNTGAQTIIVFYLASSLILMGMVLVFSGKKRKAHISK